MGNIARVINFKDKVIEFEDIKCILNILQANDLTHILLITPEDRRLDVALSFAGLNTDELYLRSGLGTQIVQDSCYSTYKRWLRHVSTLPLGAAFRLARVFGVPSDILFASPKWSRPLVVDRNKNETE